MVRLLIVLAVVAVAVVMLNFRGGKDGAPPERPETTMQHQKDNIKVMEQQLQQQAAEQLEQIDAKTQQP